MCVLGNAHKHEPVCLAICVSSPIIHSVWVSVHTATHWASVSLGVFTRACDLPVIAICCQCAGAAGVFVLVLEPVSYAEVL